MSINLNLLPWRQEKIAYQKKNFLSWLGFGLILAMSLILWIHMLIHRQIAMQSANTNVLKNEIKKLDEQLAMIQALQKEKEQLLARIEIIEQLQSKRLQIVQLFEMIAKLVPKGLYLTSLTRQGRNIVIEGKAESNSCVSTFMKNIEASLLEDPILTLIQASPQEDPRSEEKNEAMIGFNIQVQESKECEEENKNKKERWILN